ncbi:hypothetical protein KMZ68_21695 [Bradyrhizobium sediminis]|uniref:Uncharacterized protein n=1 Tax=Bradyrhizobium sediminis TaxID=2840469 RepID=A0A975RRH0_9BRAD|nr:hypothetical protein [Bradyrhizobium sediminis]QWG17550.1 hypothetical protein KMZ68_21695 [Bradyrhizobium sediminis]
MTRFPDIDRDVSDPGSDARAGENASQGIISNYTPWLHELFPICPRLMVRNFLPIDHSAIPSTMESTMRFRPDTGGEEWSSISTGSAC